MTSVSAISSNYPYYNICSGNSDILTSATRQKLIALGIPFDENISESEAKSLIKKAEASQNTPNQPISSNNMQDTITKIKNLAEKVGLTVSRDENPEKILEKIDKRIKNLLAATPQGDTDKITELKKYQTEHHNLKTKLEKITTSQKQLYAEMEMLSTQNKIALGLN